MRRLAILVVMLAGCGKQEAGGTVPRAAKLSGAGLTITSTAFRDEGEIPKKYGCSGESISPPLSIAGVPATAKTLALVVSDPDAPGGTFTHWLVWNIPPGQSSFAEGSAPGGVQGKNDFGKMGYGAPCPPNGAHHYVFDAYALDTPLGVAPSVSRDELVRAMAGHVVAQGRIVGIYRR